MATFEAAIAHLLKLEGGAVDHAADRGGATNYGLSARRYPDADLATLTRADAEAIYRRDYWHPLYERLEQPLADKLLELTVHLPHDTQRPYWQGRLAGVEMVQRACRSLGDREVVCDGRFGPQTLQAVRLSRTEALLAAIRVEQCRYYLALADKDESQRAFLRGWIRRAVA